MTEFINESFTLIVQTDHPKNENHQQQFWTNLIDQHQEIPMICLIPFQHDAPSLYCTHKRYLEQVRTQLRQRNYLLMKTSQFYIQYACHQQIVEEKIYEYMLRTKAYTEQASLTYPDHQRKVQHLLNVMVDQSIILLKNLCDLHWMTSFQYQQMNIIRSDVRLDYIYFKPNTCQQEQIFFEPRTMSVLSPLMPINRYLYRLLAPLYYNYVAHANTIDKGADLILFLDMYQQQGHLRSTTVFVTLSIKDPYTTITHVQFMQTLERFLHDFVTEEHIEGMKIPAILELSKLLLDHQYFIYQNSIYRQTVGGGTGLYFIDLLINIYLFYWQQPLLLHQNPHEVFTRYFNEIFFTWNASEGQLHRVLEMMKTNHVSSIKYHLNIQKRDIHYLDIQIHLTDNNLQTHVNHNWNYEPYMLPTFHDTPFFLPTHILRRALLRAVLCCSQLQDFEEELQYIEYSFLFNRFSFDFIRQHIEEFFHSFNVLDLTTYHDQASYEDLRRHVRQFDQQKICEKRQRLDEAQKVCIWYMHSRLKGVQLVHAKRNPTQFLPSSYADNQTLQGIKFEVIGIPSYPTNTV